MAREERRRAITALVTIVFSIVILVAPLVAIAIAQANPTISIWNPSDYGGATDDTPLVISDNHTGIDEAQSPNENTYRLMATTKNTPNPAIVEFELQISTVNTLTIGTATQRGPDAWEIDWDIPATVIDGQYTIRAILYSGSGLTAVEVARSERPVLIRGGNTPGGATAAAASDVIYPTNGDDAGFYMNPITGSTNTTIIAEYSGGTSYIEAFYTTSDPGEEPVWKSCFGPALTDNGAQIAGEISMRCVLEPVDQGGASVTGLGVIANETPLDPLFAAEYDPNFNVGGDSVRVFPYAQDAVSAVIDDAEVRRDGSLNGCSPSQFITVTDQQGNPIGGINVDVHARGPSDQLKFRVPGTPLLSSVPSSVKTPDKSHSGSTEPGFACGSSGSLDADPSGQQLATTRQAEHGLPGNPDVKHIEAAGGGTSNTGRFGIGLKSDANGGTQVTFWVDEDEDDVFCDDEPFAVGSVGFNQPAPPATGETPVLTDCPIPTPPPPGGTPSGSGPSPTDTGPQPDCTIQGTSGDDNIVGTQGNDIICAGAGDDSIDGRGGDDIIRGESGNDQIDGDIGDDTIDAGDGDDRVNGGPDNDSIDGRTGIDVLVGSEGDDTLRGQGSVDGLQGGSGNDIIQGGGGDDVADGQSGRDIMKGHKGQDILRGGSGGDTLRGGTNGDQLTGGSGRDKIFGGPGRDQCSSGSGRDRVRQCET